jgi:hypothetical protein
MNLYVQGVQSIRKVCVTESIWIQKVLEKKSERVYLQGVRDRVFRLRSSGGIVEVTYRVAGAQRRTCCKVCTGVAPGWG